jgi:predicted dienelactone hydrolase
MRRLVGTLLVATLATLGVAVGAGAAAHAQTAPDSSQPPAPGDVGPGAATYAVGRRTIEVTSEPGRALTVDVWYPADRSALAGVPKSTYAFPGLSYTSSVAYDSPPVSGDGPFPLVVYSHGSGGQRYVSAFLTEALAARGFVVVAADHTGNTALDAFAKTELPRKEILRLRPVDIRAEIDAMAAASADAASPFAGAVDTSRVGLVGHSAGGTGVLLTAAGHDGAAGDARVRGVVGLGTYVDPVSDAELARLEIPVLLVSGTLDTTTPIRTQTERAWKRIPGDPLYRVDLRGAGHESYSDVCYYEDLVAATPDAAAPLVHAIDDFAEEACTPKFLPITAAHRLIDRYAIGFLERYVAGDASAARWLEPTQPKIVSVRVKR